MRLALKVRAARALKQLELAFPPNAVATSLCEVKCHSGSDSVPQGRGYSTRELESQVRELLRALGADKLAREIRVEWNPRLKTCAGRADYREKLISLNPLLRDVRVPTPSAIVGQPLRLPFCSAPVRLGPASDALALQFQKIDEIDRTLRHELAHLLAQWRAGRRRIAPHGEEWRQACRDLGIADEARCHDLPFASKSFPPRYVYRCPNCKEEFPRVRKIRRAIACLACCRKFNGGEFDARFRLKLEGHAPSCP
jgi:SprT protein